MAQKRTININVWGTPATISISDDVLRWLYVADSFGLHRHRVFLLMRYIIKNKYLMHFIRQMKKYLKSVCHKRQLIFIMQVM